jgi:hypothetical protein
MRYDRVVLWATGRLLLRLLCCETSLRSGITIGGRSQARRDYNRAAQQ